MANYRSASNISFPPASSSSKASEESSTVQTLAPTSSSTRPLVPSSTIYKLLVFTVAMFTLPLLSYFASVDTLFAGNSSYAGGLAALVANVVLGAYIVAAVREDAGEAKDVKRE